MFYKCILVEALIEPENKTINSYFHLSYGSKECMNSGRNSQSLRTSGSNFLDLSFLCITFNTTTTTRVSTRMAMMAYTTCVELDCYCFANKIGCVIDHYLHNRYEADCAGDPGHDDEHDDEVSDCEPAVLGRGVAKDLAQGNGDSGIRNSM